MILELFDLIISQKMVLLRSILVVAALSLASVSGDDYFQTRNDYINNIVDRHLRKDMKPNDVAYRKELSELLFNALVNRYPERNFFVNVYAPVMGWDNHATKGAELFDRLHKKNDMRFNLIVSSLVKQKDIKDQSSHITENKMEYAKNFCFFRDCGNALELQNFVEQHHGCLTGVQIISRTADQHVKENFS